MGEDGDRTDGEVGLEVGRDAVRSATGGRGDGASNGDAQGVARSTQRADRGRQTRTAHTRPRIDSTLVTVELGLWKWQAKESYWEGTPGGRTSSS